MHKRLCTLSLTLIICAVPSLSQAQTLDEFIQSQRELLKLKRERELREEKLKAIGPPTLSLPAAMLPALPSSNSTSNSELPSLPGQILQLVSVYGVGSQLRADIRNAMGTYTLQAGDSIDGWKVTRVAPRAIEIEKANRKVQPYSNHARHYLASVATKRKGEETYFRHFLDRMALPT